MNFKEDYELLRKLQGEIIRKITLYRKKCMPAAKQVYATHCPKCFSDSNNDAHRKN